MRLYTVLPAVIALLQREKRLSYRALTQIFAVDEVFLHDVREELRFRQLAYDEDGKGLVWIGETAPQVTSITPHHTVPEADASASPVSLWPPHGATEMSTPPARPPVAADGVPTALPEAERREAMEHTAAVVPAPPRSAPEAERRQLTVMFCDLVGSTHLASQLDPEDWREVVRAYQVTAATVIQRYGGHIAQYLGDGLMIYFGWPQAHEDDARRAAHAGLALVVAVHDLRPGLIQDYGMPLAIRIGIHTGLVVVGADEGDVSNGQLAVGATPNLAAKIQESFEELGA